MKTERERGESMQRRKWWSTLILIFLGSGSVTEIKWDLRRSHHHHHIHHHHDSSSPGSVLDSDKSDQLGSKGNAMCV